MIGCVFVIKLAFYIVLVFLYNTKDIFHHKQKNTDFLNKKTYIKTSFVCKDVPDVICHVGVGHIRNQQFD